VDTKTKQILATAFSNGKEHDFKLFGKSRTALLPQTKCLADRGYLGIAKLHANSQTPHKRSKRHPLSKENRQLSREQFVVEHVIRSVKIFRILAERYRNRRKRFGLRFNLIAALCNAELAN
jgi:hypothetical protein